MNWWVLIAAIAVSALSIHGFFKPGKSDTIAANILFLITGIGGIIVATGLLNSYEMLNKIVMIIAILGFWAGLILSKLQSRKS